MPKITTLVKILRDGTRKSSIFSDSSDELTNVEPALRDHYTRIELFWRKKHLKQERIFVDATVARLAISADRDHVLGILDTITREFITFWMPELEIFVGGSCNELEDKDMYVKVVLGLEKHVFDAVIRLDCTKDKTAGTLRQALFGLVTSYLMNLFDMYKDLLSEDEQVRFSPYKPTSQGEARRPATSNSKATIETLSDARLLNSSIAWEIADIHKKEPPPRLPLLRSPVKRGFSQAFLGDAPDPADNGAIWDTQGTTKRQKFEVKVSKIIDLSDNEDIDKHEIVDARETRRILKPVSRSNKGLSRSVKAAKTDSDAVDLDEVQIPGALSTTNENCVVM